jgi:hypothetical protein
MEGLTHPGCASQNLTFETPALPPISCLAQRLHQWPDFPDDPVPDERCRIHERKHGISIAPGRRHPPRIGSSALAAIPFSHSASIASGQAAAICSPSS